MASASPTPGGGSAATIVAATGAALVAMVGRVCEGSANPAAPRELARSAAAEADALRERLLQAGDADELAFADVVAAQALPRGTDAERASRSQALESALRAAAEAPLHAAELALELLALTERALELRNRNLVSDLACAGEFAAAALNAAAYNVRINHRFMHDTAAIAEQSLRLARLQTAAEPKLAAIRTAFESSTQA